MKEQELSDLADIETLRGFAGISDEELRERFNSTPSEWSIQELLEAERRFPESYTGVAILHELRLLNRILWNKLA